MKIKALLVATAIAAVPAFASAQEVSTSVNVGVTSDYIFRGITQSDNKPAVFGGIDASTDKFYVGAWASRVDFGGDAHIETDLYAGYTPSVGNFDFDIGVLAYLYPQETDLNTYEAKVGGTYNWSTGISTGVTVYYAPEVGKDGPSNIYTEASISVPLEKKTGPFSWGLGFAYGYNDVEDGESYQNFKGALTASTESGWSLEVGATTTDIGKYEFATKYGYSDYDNVNGKAYATLKKEF